MIHTERNFPSQITTNETILQAVRQELILAAVDTFVDAIRPINVPVDELLRVVKEKYSEEIREEEEQ